MKFNANGYGQRNAMYPSEEDEQLMPHEWLVRVMNGHPVRQMVREKYLDENGYEVDDYHEALVYPTLDQRMKAAKEAAPYYAPKLNAHKQMVRDTTTIDEAIRRLAAELPV